MTRSIMLSVQPKWVEKILNGEKTIEIRKTMPKCEFPIDAYIYCTQGKPYLKDFKFINEYTETRFYLDNNQDEINSLNGKVVAKFTLNEITELRKMERYKATGLVLYKGAMNMGEFNKYGGKYAWHIENLKIFDEPKELSCFYKNGFNEDLDKFHEYYKWGVKNYSEDHAMELQNSYDEDINTIKQTWRITKAPQSWQFVESD